ncbi:MAG: hydrogenase formation protein HypD [Candidatus Omnitrophota bacterium]|nr:hydrogenase formation protein HypD [Candidatus Omnitrophota bacterium]
MLTENLLRDKNIIGKVISAIRSLKLQEKINIMEVCGTHTYTFFRFGLRKLLPDNINLISGPGCPVCITEDEFIDKACFLCKDKQNIIATFGDLIKVKGATSSLELARAEGANISIVYSPSEALGLAKENPSKRIIFLAVGFETTAPLTASILKEAKKSGLNNFFVLSAHRVIPPALNLLCSDREINVDGFLCPGHVSVIIGEHPYREIVKKYHKPCVICGFEPLDMVLSIYKICLQIKNGKYKLENEYNRVVKASGNISAMKLIGEIFDVRDAAWRGFGVIKKSGLFLNKTYAKFDAEKLIGKALISRTAKNIKCRCADVVKGKINPSQCPQFKKSCTIDNPLGPCMVSFEGTCRIYYEYSA